MVCRKGTKPGALTCKLPKISRGQGGHRADTHTWGQDRATVRVGGQEWGKEGTRTQQAEEGRRTEPGRGEGAVGPSHGITPVSEVLKPPRSRTHPGLQPHHLLARGLGLSSSGKMGGTLLASRDAMGVQPPGPACATLRAQLRPWASTGKQRDGGGGRRLPQGGRDEERGTQG